MFERPSIYEKYFEHKKEAEVFIQHNEHNFQRVIVDFGPMRDDGSFNSKGKIVFVEEKN